MTQLTRSLVSRSCSLVAVASMALVPLSIHAQDASEEEVPFRQTLAEQAQTLVPSAETDLGRAFLASTGDLPPMAEERLVYYQRSTRSAITPEAYEALGEEDREGYQELVISEQLYYSFLSPPMAYLRAIDLASQAGLESVDGARIADFGFGNVGQLRMLASLGAHVVGIEIPDMLEAMYRKLSDQGLVQRSSEAGPGEPGSVTLVFGQYPTTDEIISAVGSDLALFMSKNTLKKGYIHPEQEVNPRMLVHLGVSDEVYAQTVYDALAPGGLFLIYNLYPKPSTEPDAPYRPWASGECPFEKDMLTSIGFEIVRWNEDDSPKARAMGVTLGWQGEMTDEEFEHNFNAMVTILRKPE
ncbi:MAG: hypothetical protein ACF8GE_03575 [Phycisphaerales bacterium JB043]